MNEYRNILIGDAARAWKRLVGRFYWLNDSEIARHLIEVHDQWCGDQCPLGKSCDRGSSGYEISCDEPEAPPSAKSEAENEDIPLQLEVDEGAESFDGDSSRTQSANDSDRTESVDNSSRTESVDGDSSRTESVDGDCGFESDLDPVSHVEGDMKVVADATDNTPQNTGSTLARTDNLIPASGNKSTDSRAGNLSQTLISVKQEPTDSGEYENSVIQSVEKSHHHTQLTSSGATSHPVMSDTIVVKQEPTDSGEYENFVIQSVETSHHHTQLTSSGATSHPVMSDTIVVKQEPTDSGEYENSVIQSVETSHHHTQLTSSGATSHLVMSDTIVVKQEPTDSDEYENSVGQDMETTETNPVHHSPPISSSHPVRANTITTAVRAALRQKISSTVVLLPLFTNKWTNSGGDTLTQAIPVVKQEPTDSGEYENSGATSHPVVSDSMTAALEPVPNHGTSSTNTHPGSLSPVVTGRQNTELATPDTNMDSTVTLATVADTLPPRNNKQREGSLTQKENMSKKRIAEDSLYTKPVKRRLTRKNQGPSTSKKSANLSETETQSSEEDQSNQKEDQSSIEKEDQSNDPSWVAPGHAQYNKKTRNRKRGRPSVFSESERKMRRAIREKKRAKQRICVGGMLEEWNRLRVTLNLESNPHVAEFLINHHKQCQNVSTSTSKSQLHAQLTKSEMSSTDKKENGRSIVRISEDFEEEEEEEDSTPDLSLILGEKDHTDIEDVAGGDLVFGVGEMSLPEDRVGEMSLPEDRVGKMSHTEDRVGEKSHPEEEAAENVKVPGIMQILTMDESELVLKSEKVIVFEEQLLILAKSKINDQCLVKGCPEAVKISTRYVASALYLVWSCSNKHIKHRWCSQPLLSGGSQSGDLMITAAILCSGNDFCKVKRMADLLHLHFPNQSSFTQLQQKCLVPAIEETWFEHQRSERTKLNDKDVVLLGGGCLCSPGHCSQHCTFTLMENDSKKIVALETLEKKNTSKSGINLEKACFQRALKDVRKSVRVTEVVTEAQLQVDGFMKKWYSRIRHSHDVWQAAKELGKKIIAAGQDKHCKDLLNWRKDIVEHFWHSCEVANSRKEFLDIWVGMTHHVLNKHKWMSSYASLEPGCCSHGDLDEDRNKKWLQYKSPAYTALIEIVMDKQFLKNVHYFLNFRSTANLEIFNNHIWVHASERLTYTSAVYRARNILAALDYNSSVDLPSATNEDGSTRYQRTFSKKFGRWIIVERKEKKTYHHIEEIFRKSLRIQLNCE
ncbi:uncharacterized protein LOC125661398 isoform X2 [Ostrea edulis]|uniref:uncharacterized protein LOC125661398 isoform X2 n=1 Tax=Ostrea edulis TaxID=37623 RepID=UPI0024AFCBCD|nr:uncharacterized protein LOC125661398 isoform X2 [Ostrea edulis]